MTMNEDSTLAQLLRWRAAQAEAGAPPAPRAARLLALAQPWWETMPAEFAAQVRRLGAMHLAYGHAMAEPRRPERGHPVPALIVADGQDRELSVRVLYLDVGGSRMRLRLQLDLPAGMIAAETFEVTFVADTVGDAPWATTARRSPENEYRIDAEFPDASGPAWRAFKVTDRMPFRLIFRPLP